MINDKSPQSSTEALENLYDFLQGPEVDVRTLPIEEVRKELKANHIDVAPLFSEVQKRLAAERLRIARAKRERIEALLARLSPAPIAGQGLKERILGLLRDKPQLAVEYRKFETASEADLEGLLDDLGVLEMLDVPDEP